MATHTQEHAAKPLPGAVPVDDNEVELSFNLVGITHRIRTPKVELHTASKGRKDARANEARGDARDYDRNYVPIDAPTATHVADDGLSIYDGYAEVLGRWLLHEAGVSVSVNPVVRPEQPVVEDAPKSGHADLTNVRVDA